MEVKELKGICFND